MSAAALTALALALSMQAPEEPEGPIRATSRGQIEALPQDTRHVIGIGIGADEVRALLRLTGLESLELRAVVMSPQRFPDSVEPTGTITDDGLLQIASLQQLEKLTLRWQSKLGPRGLAVLPALKRLERLELVNMAVTDEALEVLSRMPSLRELVLDGSVGFSAATMRRIFELDQLREVSISWCATFDPKWLQGITALQRLERLDLGWIGAFSAFGIEPLDDELCERLAELPRLRALSLASSAVTAQGLRRLAELPLAELDLSHCLGVDGEAVPALMKLKQLAKLTVTGCRKLGPADLQQLHTMPALKQCIDDTRPIGK